MLFAGSISDAFASVFSTSRTEALQSPERAPARVGVTVSTRSGVRAPLLDRRAPRSPDHCPTCDAPRSLRVAIDTSPLLQTEAGTARYLRSLLDALMEEPPVRTGQVQIDPIRFGTRWPRSKPISAARDLWYLRRLQRKARTYDALHCPTFRGPIGSALPTIITVHDIAYLHHPDEPGGWASRYSTRYVPRVIQAATAIIAVSGFVRDELIRTFNVSDTKITVIHHGISGPFSPVGKRSEGDYILAVGSVVPRKNYERLIEATADLGVELRIVAREGWGKVDLSGPHVHRIETADDEELASLYRGARCLAYPSLYEGFGLPILEAMACGTPVVTSKSIATAEVAGDAAVLVDPTNVAEITAGIEAAISRAGQLRTAGFERVQAFSWAAAAQKTLELYRQVASDELRPA